MALTVSAALGARVPPLIGKLRTSRAVYAGSGSALGADGCPAAVRSDTGMPSQPKSSRFRRFTAAARGLVGSGHGPHRCVECGRDFMCPIEWETVGDEHWLIHSRCGECGAWRSEVVTNAEAKRYDLLLARQSEVIARGLARIDRERMAAELDRFVAALDRDLIDATDFVR